MYFVGQASHKTEHHSADYSAIVTHLFQTTLDLTMQGRYTYILILVATVKFRIKEPENNN